MNVPINHERRVNHEVDVKRKETAQGFSSTGSGDLKEEKICLLWEGKGRRGRERHPAKKLLGHRATGS